MEEAGSQDFAAVHHNHHIVAVVAGAHMVVGIAVGVYNRLHNHVVAGAADIAADKLVPDMA